MQSELTPYRVIAITARSLDPNVSFVSRVFAPLSGIPEDPATGSMHCLLGPYWKRTLANVQTGEEMHARQVGRRASEIDVIWDEELGRCKLRGQARVTSKGEFYL